MLFEAIKKEGYTGSYSILKDYARDRREGFTTSGKSAYVPIKFELSEACDEPITTQKGVQNHISLVD